MLKNLSYKQKLKGLGIAAVLALLLCYRLSISRTVDEYRKYAETGMAMGAGPEDGLTSGEGAGSGDGPGSVKGAGLGSFSLAGLQVREEKVDVLFRLYALDTLRPEKNLLSVASNYCKGNGLQLKEYKPYALSQNDSIPVLTRIVTVQGGFIPCLKFLNALETGQKVGKLSSADFRSYVDPQDKKTKLDCTLYIQNLIVVDHEGH